MVIEIGAMQPTSAKKFVVIIYIHTLSFSLSSRWKFTFYLYIFTYGVRFLKKVSVCLVVFLHTFKQAMTLFEYNVAKFDRWARKAWKCGGS